MFPSASPTSPAPSKFYDAALKPLGYSRLSDGETSLGYGDKAVALWLGATQQPVPADSDSGLHSASSPRIAPRRRLPRGGAQGRRQDNGKPGAAHRLRPQVLCRLRRRSRRLPDRSLLRKVTLRGSPSAPILRR